MMKMKYFNSIKKVNIRQLEKLLKAQEGKTKEELAQNVKLELMFALCEKKLNQIEVSIQPHGLDVVFGSNYTQENKMLLLFIHEDDESKSYKIRDVIVNNYN